MQTTQTISLVIIWEISWDVWLRNHWSHEATRSLKASNTVVVQFQIVFANAYYLHNKSCTFIFTTTLAEFNLQFQKLLFLLQLTQLFFVIDTDPLVIWSV